MMNQATSIIAEALLYSLLAGAATYIVLRLLLALLKNIPALIKYHLCNISLLIPLLTFIVSLTPLTTIKDTAPVYPSPPPVATTYNNVQVAAIQQEPVQDETLTAEMLWAEVHGIINENSQAITWLYIAGLLLFSARLLLQYRQSQQLKTKGLLPATDEWYRLLANTMQRLRITRPIHIAFTERKISPCIIGHAKAVILIPISLANHLTTEQAEAILLHELAHYKQYDHYINLGVQCVKCLLFFNPFVWLSAILIDKYRELSCDETATRHERNIELAETLAMIARIQAKQNSLVMNLKKNNPLLTRVQALLHIREYDKSSHRLLPLVVTTIVLATGLLIAGSTKLFSTEKDNLREQLKEISAQMYKEGNHKYIFVDAVLDSLITLPVKGDVFYMGNNQLFIGGMQLEGRLKTSYNQKLKAFLIAQGEDGEHVVTIAAMPDKKELTLAHIINPSSDFRKCTARDRYNAHITTRAWQQVFSELYDDKLIQSAADRFQMYYSQKGIVVNSDTLKGNVDTKYRKLFKEVVGIDLNDNSVSGSMTIGDMKKYLSIHSTIEIADTTSQREKLTQISDELFNKGDMHYVFVDALIDGTLKDGDDYDLKVDSGIVRFKSHRWPVSQQKKYSDKLAACKKANKGKGRFYSSMLGTIHLNEILDPNSEFRNPIIHTDPEIDGTPFMEYIMAEMQKDGLIDRAYQVRIIFTDSTIVVNNKNLTGSIYNKYRSLHKQAHPIYGKNFSNSLQCNTDQPFPPDNETGINFLEQQRLAELSEELFRNGHQGFIIAELVRDGYIKKGEKYKVSYKNGKFSIEGKSLPAEVIKNYEAKMAKFTAVHPSTATVWWSLEDTYDATNTADEFNLKLGGGIPSDYEKEQKEKEREANFWKFIQAMHKDGLLDTNSYYLVEYKKDGLYVNAIKLTGGKEKKYTDWLHALGYTAAKGMRTERVPDGVKIPDRRVGISTVSMPVYGNNMPAIAQLMFVDGNPNFILAHALHDKLIREGQRYDIRYVRGKVYSRGELIREPYQSRYARLITDFTHAHNTPTGSYAVHGDGVTKEELNTPGSAIRRKVIGKGQGIDAGKVVGKVIGMMAADGIVDTTKRFTLQYNAQGLFVNNKRPTGKNAQRYEEVLNKELGNDSRITTFHEINFEQDPDK